ncbi:prepilin-type N-terminal cleavage/methylation domain-containing protein [Bordetella tumbae]|uniref:prepilin-type N-terminal cleavage/methylation domain-containing protein n=1 Tax=Bordetella tumbae TaxID=1649139 RepID=UPI0039EED0E2
MRPRTAQQGFTLIEVLIAIALMALVSLLSWKGLEQVSNARDWLGEESADQAIVLRTLGQIERDLNRAYAGAPAGTTSSTSDSSDGTGTTTPSGSITLLPPGIDITQSSGAVLLNLIRATPENGQWQRVMWRLRPDGLWRYSGAPGSSYPLPEPDQGVLIMPDVSRLDVRAWLTGQGWINPLQPATARAAGLEIAIERPRGNQKERYTRIVVLS